MLCPGYYKWICSWYWSKPIFSKTCRNLDLEGLPQFVQFNAAVIIRQCIEYKLPLYINFVDFKSAFNCINKNFIWQAFWHYGLPDKYVRVIRAFFDGTVSAVQYNGEFSRWFDVANGTGQEDIQGPPIFNVCLNWAAEMAEMHKTISRGLVL